MSKPYNKFSIAVSVLAFLALLVIAGFYPSTGLMLGIGLLVFSVTATSIAIIKRYRQAYQQGEITRIAFVRNAFNEVTVVLLAAILAGLLGRYFARLATAPIPAECPKLVAGLVVGVSVGAGVGLLARRVRGRWARG